MSGFEMKKELFDCAAALVGEGMLLSGASLIATQRDGESFVLKASDWSAIDDDDVMIDHPLKELFNVQQDATWIALTQPKSLVTLSMMNKTLARCLLPSAFSMPCQFDAQFAGHGSIEGLSLALMQSSDLLLGHIGVLSRAKTSFELIARLKTLEDCASRTLYLIEHVSALDEIKMHQIADLFAPLGIELKPDCELCNACSNGRLNQHAAEAFNAHLSAAIDEHLRL